MIIIAGLCIISGLFQAVIWHILLSLPEPNATTAPGSFRVIVEVLVLVVAALSLFVLITAIALVKRRNWARRVFVGLFGLAIVLNLSGLLLFIASAGMLVPATGEAEEVKTIVRVVTISACIQAAGLSVLFGWLIKRLMSTGVREEFGGRPST